MKYSNIFSRLVNASRYSLDGLIYALKNEQAFRYEAVVFVIVCIAVLLTDFPAWWSMLLIGAWVIVMCFELVNSATEKAFDLIDTRIRPEIKAGKDMLSAAVFLSIFFNIILWCIAIIIHV